MNKCKNFAFVYVKTDGFACQGQNYSVKGVCFTTVQCNLVQKRYLKIKYTGYAGKSKVPSMKKARFRLDIARNGA